MYVCVDTHMDFPGGSVGKESACSAGGNINCGLNPLVGEIPWRRAWQSTLVLLPRESHGWRSLVGYSPEGHRELDTTEATVNAHTHIHSCTYAHTYTHIRTHTRTYWYVDLNKKNTFGMITVLTPNTLGRSKYLLFCLLERISTQF